jgi:glycerophosphoryl diester phosphodiesterase
MDLTRAPFLAKARRLGLPVDYWVINDPAEASALLDRGADGIVTDAPGLMAQVFAEHPRTEGWRQRHPSG